MTLHILQNPARLDECLSTLSDDDVVLFIDRAVYAYRTELAQRLPCPARVLSEDASIAGVTAEDSVLASFEDWVQLSEQHPQSLNWY